LYRPSVKYLVIVGNDGTIPFFRQADQSLLAPESQYAPPVRDTSASQASLRNSLVLTQDPYGADLFVSYDAQALPLPDVAVGRLVETAGEIVGQIDAFLNMASTGLVPHSSLVTGYDFLEDVANEVKDELDRGIRTAGDKLLAHSPLSPYATAETDPTVPLDSLPWTAAQLSQALLGQRHDLIFLAGHFSAQSA